MALTPEQVEQLRREHNVKPSTDRTYIRNRPNVSVAEIVALAKRDPRLTQAELARHFKVSQSYISTTLAKHRTQQEAGRTPR